MVQQISTNTFGVAKWVVSSDATQGTHTTIASALTAASSGDTIFIRDGTYTENLTLKAGVSLAALDADGFANVIILGKCTFSGSGTVNVCGILFKTNSDFALVVSGSNNSTLNATDCVFVSSNNTAISLTSSGLSSIFFSGCTFDLQTTGIAYHSMTNGSNIHYIGCFFNNSGSSTTASSNSAGAVLLEACSTFGAYSCTSTGSLGLFSCNVDTSAINTTTITTNGTGSNVLSNCYIASGTAVPCSVGTGAVLAIGSCTINTANTNVVTGLGQVTYVGIDCIGTGTAMNATTKVGQNTLVGGISFDAGTNVLSAYSTGTFTPAIKGKTTAGTAAYTTQSGRYTRIGNRIFFDIQLNWNTATGTGQLEITGLPFTASAGATGTNDIGAFTAALGAGITSAYLSTNNSTTIADVYSVTAATGAIAAVVVPASAVLQCTGFYEV